MSIKLICSDIDGTLLQYGRTCWRAAQLCWKNCADRRTL